jgi:adenosylcobyric acid synthase
VVVMGRSIGSMAAGEYQRRKLELWPTVTEALDRLRSRYEIVVAEGAGSPAEINLMQTDLANMRVARHAGAAVLLVGDIDRGGVFASLLGTLELLESEDRRLVRGFAINKFRGDPAILAPGLDFLVERTGVPVLGVIPYLKNLDLPEEDSMALDERRSESRHVPVLDIAVIRLPRIANFDEFAPLSAEPVIRLRYVERADDLGEPDLAIIPGTKTTVADLNWLSSTGLAARLALLPEQAVPLLGICGGYQMLGLTIRDPHGSESDQPTVPGLGLLPVVTTFAATKRTVRVRGEVLVSSGPLAGARGCQIVAYEIHMGETVDCGGVHPLVAIEEQSGQAVTQLDGSISADGLVMGTYLHGLLENDGVRHALIDALLARRQSKTGASGPESSLPHHRAVDREAELDRLASTVRAALDLPPLLAACGLG